MDFDSQELKQCLKALKKIDFELAYLALLTREGLKPLSRWEKTLNDHELELLEKMGLLTKQIHRTVKTGKLVVETIFSVSAGYIQVYENSFGNTPIDKSAQTQRFEGFSVRLSSMLCGRIYPTPLYQKRPYTTEPEDFVSLGL